MSIKHLLVVLFPSSEPWGLRDDTVLSRGSTVRSYLLTHPTGDLPLQGEGRVCVPTDLPYSVGVRNVYGVRFLPVDVLGLRGPSQVKSYTPSPVERESRKT